MEKSLGQRYIQLTRRKFINHPTSLHIKSLSNQDSVSPTTHERTQESLPKIKYVHSSREDDTFEITESPKLRKKTIK